MAWDPPSWSIIALGQRGILGCLVDTGQSQVLDCPERVKKRRLGLGLGLVGLHLKDGLQDQLWAISKRGRLSLASKLFKVAQHKIQKKHDDT